MSLTSRTLTSRTGQPRTAATARWAGDPDGSDAAVPVSRTAAHLDEVVAIADRRDRQMGRLVGLLVAARSADDLADVTGGMSLQVWLQHTARCTHTEACDLLGAAETLAVMPATLAGLADGWLSWSQTSAICRAARRVPVGRRGELDELVGAAMTRHRGWEPDALVADVWDWVDTAQPSRLEQAEAAADRGQFVTLAPQLFGGGSLYGQFGTVGFATLAEALDAPLGPPVTAPDDRDDHAAVDAAFEQLDAQRRAVTRQHGAALADRLVALCQADLAGSDTSQARPPRPLVLATVDLDALLDTTRTPGWLLHTLAGGRMKVSATALQQLVDARGADLHTIVLDQVGQALGAGQTTRVPPGWLRQAIWARDLAVRDPDASTPVRRADLDHLTAWPDGPTTVDNLHPLGRTWHNHKTSRHWTVTRARDGTTTWRHQRHGWTLRLAPPRRDLTDPPDPGPPRLPPPTLPDDDLPEPAPT